MFDRGVIPALLQQDVVRRLGPLLIDDNRGIQEGAAGTLRYIAHVYIHDMDTKAIDLPDKKK